MKTNKIYLAVTLSFMLVIIMSVSGVNMAIADAEFNSRCEDNIFTFGLRPSDDEWASLTYFEILDLLSMPDEWLPHHSTDMLTDLALDFPWLINIFAFNTPIQAMESLERSSNIFVELFSRDDHRTIMLDRFEQLHVDYSMLIDNERLEMSMNDRAIDVLRDSGFIQELFFHTYFAVEIESMNRAELARLTSILHDNHERKVGIICHFATAFLIFDNIQTLHGSVAIDLIPDNMLNQMLSDDFFEVLKSNSYEFFSRSFENEVFATDSIPLNSLYPPPPENCILGVYIEVELDEINTPIWNGFLPNGNVFLLGTTTVYDMGTLFVNGRPGNALRFRSGDFYPLERMQIDIMVRNSFPSWSFVSSATRQFNCHAFSWTPARNMWVSIPSPFVYGFSVPRSQIRANDRAIILSTPFMDEFGTISNAVHSMNIRNASGWNRSKLGTWGVFDAPLVDIEHFYNAHYTLFMR